MNASTAALASFARFYNSNFDRRPVPTLMVTNGILNTIADLLAQSSSIFLHTDPDTPKHEYSLARTGRFAAFGMLMGPIIGGWMRILEKQLPLRKGIGQRGGNGLQLTKRVLADQLVMAPIGMVIFTSSMGFMEGKTPFEIKQKFSDVFVPALLANWKVWPVIQAVNFSLMPLPYRVPFQSTCGIGWVLYLSLLNASRSKQ
ncbi:hypothetical protein EHS25_007466 [Saitozyma podzolica]|uniref:Protein required for ethanol metabolism n=1 Tax=Saitozyma podzolica TaxID=1890683 RepID=A0A427YPU2_9TREE|nr:hypothetical protein EHS25_007466 [Saitozyma podzolica]